MPAALTRLYRLARVCTDIPRSRLARARDTVTLCASIQGPPSMNRRITLDAREYPRAALLLLLHPIEKAANSDRRQAPSYTHKSANQCREFRARIKWLFTRARRYYCISCPSICSSGLCADAHGYSVPVRA